MSNIKEDAVYIDKLKKLYSHDEMASIIYQVSKAVEQDYAIDRDWFFSCILREVKHIKSDSRKYHTFGIALKDFINGD